MGYLNYHIVTPPSGLRKLLYMNWPLVVLQLAIVCMGFLMLYSVGGGDPHRWAEPQMERFAVGFVLSVTLAFVPIWFWRTIAIPAYLVCIILLVLVEVIGHVGMGAQRWISIGPVRIQPSEVMKLSLILLLAAYYDWLDVDRRSRLIWVILPLILVLIPTALVLKQPDLGTALMLVLGGGIVMFVAGVSLWYFGAVIMAGIGVVWAVLASRGTDWQLLRDYQYRRIDSFLDPAADPLGAGYNIAQAQIALGSGGWSGRGFMQGTQSRLNFLPEKHTDFIFTTLAEEFGFVGASSLLALYVLLVGFCLFSAFTNRDRFGALVTFGIAGMFFLYFAINMGMVMGLLPVVGVPLPMVSYGGTQMIILLMALGIVQSAHINRP